MSRKRIQVPRHTFNKFSFIQHCVVLIFSGLNFAKAQSSSCALPPTSPSKEFKIMPADCTLTRLKLDKESFVLIADRTPKRDHDSTKRFVGIPKKGLILETLPDGKVFSVKQTSRWESQDKIESFDTIMKREFINTPKIIKKGPSVIEDQEQRQEQP